MTRRHISTVGAVGTGGPMGKCPNSTPSFRPPSALCLYCRNKNKSFSKAPPWIYKSSYGPEYWRQVETLLKGPSNPIRPWVHIFITNPGWSLWNEPSAVVPIHSIDSTYYTKAVDNKYYMPTCTKKEQLTKQVFHVWNFA